MEVRRRVLGRLQVDTWALGDLLELFFFFDVFFFLVLEFCVDLDFFFAVERVVDFLRFAFCLTSLPDVELLLRFRAEVGFFVESCAGDPDNISEIS